MTDGLKPCPFCGSIHIKIGKNFVQCVKCRAKIEDYTYSSQDAVREWNNRAEPDELPEWAMEGIKQLIDEIFEDVNSSPCCLNEWKKKRLNQFFSLKRGLQCHN